MNTYYHPSNLNHRKVHVPAAYIITWCPSLFTSSITSSGAHLTIKSYVFKYSIKKNALIFIQCLDIHEKAIFLWISLEGWQWIIRSRYLERALISLILVYTSPLLLLKINPPSWCLLSILNSSFKSIWRYLGARILITTLFNKLFR